jgi:protein-tyrosine-phosphatase
MEPDAPLDRPVPTTFNILYVCTGNTCRSPMAEVLTRAELERRGWTHVRVASAGVAADPGNVASRHAQTVVSRRGLDLGSHASRLLTPELLAWADLVLAMSPSQLPAIAYYAGEEKTALIGEFAAGREGGGYRVSDPFGCDEEVYEQTLDELTGLVARVLDRLAPILSP